MPGAAELEKLVVRLVGDGGGFEKMLDKAVDDTRAAVKEIEKATNDALHAQEAFEEAARIIDSVKTPTEKYTESVDALAAMHKAGRLPTESYYRALKAAGQQLPHVQAAQAAYAAEVERGKEITKAARTPIMRYRDSLAELDKMHRAGHISAQVHARSVANLNKEFGRGGHAIMAYGKQIAGVGSGMRRIGAGMTLGLTAPIIAAGVGLGKLAADAETTETQFKAMLGEAKGMEVLGDLRGFAAKTPFQFGDVAATGKTLLAFGVEQEQLMDTMKMVGDVAAGTGKDYRELGVIFGQIRGMGRLQGQDFLQLVNAGFPVAEIAKTMGVSMETLKDEMEKGNVPFEVVEATFKRITSEGGLFNDMMEKMSKTAAGQFSNLIDKATLLGQKLGKHLLPIGIKVIDWLNVAVDYFEKLSPEIQLAAVWVAAVVAALGPFVTMLGLGIGAVGGLTTVIGFFMTIGLKLTLIVAAIAVGVALWVGVFLAAGAAVAYLVYQIVGPASLQAAFTTVLETGKRWAMNIIGFVWNIRKNMDILLKWLPRHWDEILQDMLRLWFVFATNAINNLAVLIKTAVRLFNLWKGFMVGVFSQLFTVDFILWVGKGIMKAGAAFGAFAVWVAEKMKAALTGGGGPDLGTLEDMLGLKDVARGAKSKDIFGDMFDIIKEESANLNGPLEGFESSISRLPPFMLELGGKAGEALAEGVKKGSARARFGGYDPAAAANAAMTAQLGKDVDEFTKGLQTQVAEFGRHGTALEIWKLQQRGATEEQLAAAVAADATLKSLQADEVVRGLEQQVAMFGKAGSALELYNLKQAGASEAQLAQAEALYTKLDAMQAEKDLMEEGKRLMDQHRTPEQKYAEEQKRLGDLFNANAIDLWTYTEALEAARKDMEQGVTVNFKTEGVESLEAGSAAAYRALVAFRRAATPTANLGGALPGVPGGPGGVVAAARPVGGAVMDRRGTAVDRATGPTKGATPHEAKVEVLLAAIADSTKRAVDANGEPAAL
jgi:tape measure domain-containing protein